MTKGFILFFYKNLNAIIIFLIILGLFLISITVVTQIDILRVGNIGIHLVTIGFTLIFLSFPFKLKNGVDNGINEGNDHLEVIDFQS